MTFQGFTSFRSKMLETHRLVASKLKRNEIDRYSRVLYPKRMDSLKTAKTLTQAAYGILTVGIVAFLSLASIPWGAFIAWPLIIIGFLGWAILLTIADRHRGADKKAVYKRNQIIFLVLLALIIIVTLFSTVLR